MKKFFKVSLSVMLMIVLMFSFAACEDILAALFGSQLVSISVETDPDKLTYQLGESIDLEGGELRLHYSADGDDEIISMTNEGVTTAGYQKNAAGEQDVTIKYKGKTTEITVYVFGAGGGTENPDAELPERNWGDYEPAAGSNQTGAIKPHLIAESEREENPVRPVDSFSQTTDLSNVNVSSANKISDAYTLLLNTVVDGKKPIVSADPQNPVTKVYTAAKTMLNTFILNDFSEFERVHTIYDWLVYYVDYDYDILDAYLADRSTVDGNNSAFHISGVFNSGLAVCDGISKAFTLLCAMEGIQVQRVLGWYKNDNTYVGHAWNKVRIQTPGNPVKAWFFADATFGNIAINNGGGSNAYESYLTHGYFLLTDEQSSEHLQDDTYNSPTNNYTRITKKSTLSAGQGGIVYGKAVTEWSYYGATNALMQTMDDFIDFTISAGQSGVEAFEIMLDFDTDSDGIRSAFSTDIFMYIQGVSGAWWIQLDGGVYLIFLEYV